MMKSIFTAVSVCVLSVCIISGAYAAQVAWGNISAQQGGTATLEMTFSGGTEPYAGVNAKVPLPEGVSVTDVSVGTLIPTGFTVDYYFNDAENWMSVIAYSGGNTFDADGMVLTLNVQVAGNVTPGTYPLAFDLSGLSNADGSVSVTHTTADGLLEVTEQAQNSFLLWTK